MKTKCSYCKKKYDSGSKKVKHKGMGVFTCTKSDAQCQNIKNNLPKLA